MSSRVDALAQIDVALTRIGRMTNSRRAAQYRSQLSGVDLQPTTVRTLATIYRHGPVRLTDVALHVDLEPSRVSKEVNRLVEAGLVAQQADATDGRAVLLTVTDAGAEAFTRYRATADQILADRLQHWPDGELEDLAAKLTGLADSLAGQTGNNS